MGSATTFWPSLLPVIYTAIWDTHSLKDPAEEQLESVLSVADTADKGQQTLGDCRLQMTVDFRW